MSMNLWLGGFGGSDLGISGWDRFRIYRKETDLVDPGPSRTFVLLDMREDSIDIGNFATAMEGWPDKPGLYGFYDFPASYHGIAGGLSFADGHAEIRRWMDERTRPPLVAGDYLEAPWISLGPVASPGNTDVRWLQERATRPVSDSSDPYNFYPEY
jgi:hypothetical protein